MTRPTVSPKSSTRFPVSKKTKVDLDTFVYSFNGDGPTVTVTDELNDGQPAVVQMATIDDGYFTTTQGDEYSTGDIWEEDRKRLVKELAKLPPYKPEEA